MGWGLQAGTFVYRAVQRLNHRWTALPRTHSVAGVEFRTYKPFLLDDPFLERIATIVGDGDIIYDVGANLGVYTCCLAAAGCRVVTLEPNPEVFEWLRRNIAANSFRREPTLCNVAAGNRSSQLPFYVSSSHGRSSFNEYNAEYGYGEVVSELLVPVRTLDELVTEHGSPDHVKIDVEGHGLEVLEGAEETLSTARPNIFVELHEAADGDYRTDAVRRFLRDHDYRMQSDGYRWECVPAEAALVA